MKVNLTDRVTRLLIGLLCFLTVLLIGAMFRSQPQSSALTIQLVGFTNAAGQPGSPIFGVTNASRSFLIFCTAQPQVRTGTAWDAVVFKPGRVLRLDPGQGTIICVAVPSIGDGWRLPIGFNCKRNEFEFCAHRAKNLLRALQQQSWSGWDDDDFGVGKRHTCFSTEIEPPKGVKKEGGNHEWTRRNTNRNGTEIEGPKHLISPRPTLGFGTESRWDSKRWTIARRVFGSNY